MTDTTEIAPPSVRTPPYVAFRSFLTLLEDLKAHGVPPQIDNSVLKRCSGTVGAQVVAALKYLGYVDEQKKVLPLLKEAVDTYKTDAFSKHLQKVINDSYQFLSSIDLKTATPGMFSDAFRKNFGAKEDVIRKCRTFYIQAAQQAGVSLGSRLKGSGPVAASTNGAVPRKRIRAKQRPTPQVLEREGDSSQHAGHGQRHQTQKALEYQLVDLMSEPDIDDTVKQSIWALVQYLMARKAKAQKQTAVANEATAA